MTDPDLFGQQFSGDSWTAWRDLLAGFYGLPLDEAQFELFQRITALPQPVNAALLELWLAVGRRGRKVTNSGLNGRKRGRNQGLHAPWLPVKSAATWQ